MIDITESISVYLRLSAAKILLIDFTLETSDWAKLGETIASGLLFIL